MRASLLNPACKGSFDECPDNVVDAELPAADDSKDIRGVANVESSLESVVIGVLSSDVLPDEGAMASSGRGGGEDHARRSIDLMPNAGN